ncbi:hypothetical protein FOVG_00903 [Fusarium oxysporum f. sp. pisi HDV247]|nr:hypothetical protein FOVG_00903 [Fusarium oxysporum f. sp. pisi HDV247]
MATPTRVYTKDDATEIQWYGPHQRRRVSDPPRAHPATNPTIQIASQFLRMARNGDSEAPSKKSNADCKAMFLASGMSEDKKTEDGGEKKEKEPES